MSNDCIIVKTKTEGNVAESYMAIVCFIVLNIISMTFSYDDRCLAEVSTRHAH
jgi:hypothetical protein